MWEKSGKFSVAPWTRGADFKGPLYTYHIVQDYSEPPQTNRAELRSPLHQRKQLAIAPKETAGAIAPKETAGSKNLKVGSTVGSCSGVMGWGCSGFIGLDKQRNVFPSPSLRNEKEQALLSPARVTSTDG